MLRNKAFLFKIFLAFVIVESAWVFFVIASIPSDAKNALFFGFSASRLVLLGSAFLIFFTTTILLGWIFTSASRSDYAIKFIHGYLLNDKKRHTLNLICGFIVLIGGLFLLMPAERVGDAIYQRSIPIVLLGIAITFQTLVFQFILLDEKIYWERLAQWRISLLVTGGVLIIFTFLLAFILWSSIGIQPERSGWFAPGTPVLAQQVLFAWAIGWIFILLVKSLNRFEKSNKLDFVMGIILWLAAGLMWWMEPVRSLSYFTTDPTPPNFESYPYSDSALYDTFAQNFLIGTGRQFGLTLRALYSIFLAIFHALGGQNFETITMIQIFALAAFPVLVYLLVSKLGGRPAGILAALIMIFRERNSIALTNVIEVSHSKLLMSDVPTLALMLIFVYFFVKWLQDQKSRYYLGVLAGASLGLTILIRSQAQFLIPIAVLGIIITKKNGWKSVLQKSLLILLSVLVVVAPWVWRNYQVSGRVLVEYQNFYTRIIASGYTDAPSDTERLPAETLEQYDDRMISMVVNYIRDNPAKVMKFYSSYFIHNEISSVIYLPMTLQFWDIRPYVNEMGFWDPPLEDPSVENLPMFFLALCIIAVGIGFAFQRAKWIGVMPLIFHFVYSFSVVPFRASGWRYILPVDWVSVLYFSIGLMQITMMLFSLFSKKYDLDFVPDEPVLQDIQSQTFAWKKILSVLGVISIIGLSLPLAERSMPVRYPAMGVNELLQIYASDGIEFENGNRVSASDVESFLETEADAVVLYGRALYPSFYESGKYWGDDDSYPPAVRSISRLQFKLIGPQSRSVFIPSLVSPQYFPHASDVFVIGCATKDGIRALAVKVNNNPFFISTSPWQGLTCSAQ